MRHASPTAVVSLEKVLWATLLACCLHAVAATDEAANAKSSGDDSLQVSFGLGPVPIPLAAASLFPSGRSKCRDAGPTDGDYQRVRKDFLNLWYCLRLQMNEEMPKRDWSKNLQMWGKRGWNNLHGGWGLKRSVPSLDQMSYSTPVVQKRAWQSLQGGWGKRFLPSEDDLEIQELASMLEQQDHHSIPAMEPDSSDFDVHDEEKRNWNKFSDGWGKRTKWDKFRGVTLCCGSGPGGKRDPAWSNLKGIWGKRSVPDEYVN
ncbi:hypothetical protein NQ318_000338 [Aromia moschata]|uniref:Uncharacterized protein n=1 Tax=Aromia moschata TaxID=1265417 RepID=A0AAV8XTE8_9CUCU|nr:hypothetical protein NQ318_000338 [Aromia moschata]